MHGPSTMSRCPRFVAAVLLFPVVMLAQTREAAALVPGQLTLHEGPGVLTIQYGGQRGYIGIPSWKAVVSREEAGNITALHVPADHPTPLSSRTGQWPISILQSKTNETLPSSMSKGRENYAEFPVPIFKVVENGAERIVVEIGGASKFKHFEHHRIYTFTARGIQIEGSLLPLIDLRSVSFDPHWNRLQIADTYMAAVPMRTQGRLGWSYMASSGRDGATALPEAVDFPLEVELKLRRKDPIFLKIYYDKNFEAGAGKRELIHNNKDGWEAKADKIIFEKMVGLAAGPVAKGAKQTFKARFEFETQPWDE